MTFWRSFISNMPLDMERIQRHLQAWLTHVICHVNGIQERLKENYPQSYFSLVVRSHIITVSRYVDDIFAEQHTFHFSEETKSSLSHYLEKYSDLPIHIIIQGGETDFRIASLKHVRFFDRPSLLRQIKIGEFSHSHWTQKFHIPTEEDSHRYLLAGVRPTQVLKNIVEFLSLQSNPLAGAHLWPILVAQQALSQTSTLSTPWVFVLHKQDGDFWHLTVCQKGAVVMYRHGFFDTNQNPEQQLVKEVVSTLRYLHRNGFQDGENITIIQTAMPPLPLPTDIVADSLILDSLITPYAPLLKRFSPQDIISNLRLKFSQEAPCTQTSLWLPELVSQRLAFLVCQFLTHLLPPLILFLGIGGVLFFIKSYGQNQKFKTLEGQLTHISIKNEDQKNLKNAQLFQFYKKNIPHTPAHILKTISKVIPPSAVAFEIKWGSLDTKEYPLFFKAKIVFDETSFGKTKKVAKALSLEAQQKKIEAGILKDFPKAHVQWQPTNSKYQFTLNISYGHDS